MHLGQTPKAYRRHTRELDTMALDLSHGLPTMFSPSFGGSLRSARHHNRAVGFGSSLIRCCRPNGGLSLNPDGGGLSSSCSSRRIWSRSTHGVSVGEVWAWDYNDWINKIPTTYTRIVTNSVTKSVEQKKPASGSHLLASLFGARVWLWNWGTCLVGQSTKPWSRSCGPRGCGLRLR